VTERTVILVGRTRQDRRLETRSTEDLDSFQRPRFLYLTRGQRKTRVVRESFWRRQEKAPTFLPEAHTWGSYRQFLAERFGDGCPELSDLSRDLLVGRLWRRLRPNMKRWSKLPDSPATRMGLARLLDDWQLSFDGEEAPEAGATPGQLPFATAGLDISATSATNGVLEAGLQHDLWLLVSEWRKTIEATPGWTDRAATNRALLRTLRAEHLPAPLILHLQRFSSLVVDDLLWLNPLERRLLDAVVDAFRRAVPSGQIHLCVETGRLAADDLSRFMRADDPRLENGGSLASVALRKCWHQRLEQGTASLRLADRDAKTDDITDTLSRDGCVDLGREKPTGAIRLRHYGSELAEVRAIARSLKSALQGGAQPRDCAVAFPALDRYLPLIRDSFTAYGIPFVIEKGAPLLASPPVSAARQLLSFAVAGGDLERLRVLLASGWIGFHCQIRREDVDDMVAAAFAGIDGQDIEARKDAEDLRLALHKLVGSGQRVSAVMDELHRTLVECGAAADQPRHWLQPVLAYHRARIRGEIKRRADTGEGEIRSRGWQRVARHVLKIHVLQRLYVRITSIARGSDAQAVVRDFKDLMAELQLEVVELANGAPEDPLLSAATDANRSALNSFYELLDEVCVAIAVCSGSGSPEAAAPPPIRMLRDALEQAVADCHFRSGQRSEGVSVTGVRDLHGVDIPWLWVGGAVEGEFPRSPRPSFLLPHQARSLIESLTPAHEDRALFFSLLRNADHGEMRDTGFLCISWPRTVAGKDVAASPLVQDLISLRTSGATAASLNEHWQQLQQLEEGALPALLSIQELLAEPLVEESAIEFLDAPMQERLALHRKLHMERSELRWFGRWDGVLGLDSPHRQVVLGWLRERLSGGPTTAGMLRFSATAIESWARCPMRFFLARVLRAEDPSPWSPDPGPPLQGTLVHRVLERLFEERIAAVAQGTLSRAGLESMPAQQLAELKLRLRDLTHQVADEVLGSHDSPYRAEMLRQLTAGLDPNDSDNGAFSGRLANFVDEEAQPFLDLDPVRTEWSFAPFNPGAVAADIDGLSPSSGDLEVRVSGTVDRIDGAGTGQAGLGGAQRAVYDYKTGRVSGHRHIDLGINMQPVIYAAAAGSAAELEKTVTGYRELPTSTRSGRTRLVGDPQALGALSVQGRVGRGFSRTSLHIDMALWAALLRRVEWYAQLIGSGVFPTTLAGTKEAGCKHCDYRRACRHDPLRVARTGGDGDAVGSFLPRPQSAREALAVLQATEAEAGRTEDSA